MFSDFREGEGGRKQKRGESKKEQEQMRDRKRERERKRERKKNISWLPPACAPTMPQMGLNL